MIRTIIVGFFFFFAFLFVVMGVGLLRLFAIGKRRGNFGSYQKVQREQKNRFHGEAGPEERTRNPFEPRIKNFESVFEKSRFGTSFEHRQEKDISNRAKILDTASLHKKDSQETPPQDRKFKDR